MLDGTLTVEVKSRGVEFAVTVTNADTEPVDLQFRSGKVADVAVYDRGSEVWRWSEGRMFTQAVRTETLAPGESFTHEVTWVGASPGKYTAEATLEATNVTLVERTEFAVPPPSG
ncbi:MAG: BsuPI-related putative proteinase inhibitor [Haloarculaceae archaeon]